MTLCIICGTLSASGGGLLFYCVCIMKKIVFEIHDFNPLLFLKEHDNSASSLNRAFFLALFYYCMLNVHSYMPWSTQVPMERGHSFLSLMQVMNFLITYYDEKIDIFLYLGDLILQFFSISRVVHFDKFLCIKIF